MCSKPSNNFDYDAYYDWKEPSKKSAYVYDGNKTDEYVYYEHDNGEYIFESRYNLAPAILEFQSMISSSFRDSNGLTDSKD